MHAIAIHYQENRRLLLWSVKNVSRRRIEMIGADVVHVSDESPQSGAKRRVLWKFLPVNVTESRASIGIGAQVPATAIVGFDRGERLRRSDV